MEYYIFVKIVTLPLFFIYPTSFVSSLFQSREEEESMGLIKFFKVQVFQPLPHLSSPLLSLSFSLFSLVFLSLSLSFSLFSRFSLFLSLSLFFSALPCKCCRFKFKYVIAGVGKKLIVHCVGSSSLNLLEKKEKKQMHFCT